jgi:hypothetical protein
MKRLNIIIVILFVLSQLRIIGQDISVKAAFDTSRIYIGDQTNFSITVDQPAGLRLNLPQFHDTLSHNIEILSGPVTDSTSMPDNRLRIISKYLVTSFDSGLYQVKPVYVELKDPNGIKRYYSDYSILQVSRVRLTPPDSSSKIFDIVAPYKAPVTIGEILPWLFLALVVALIIWAIIRYGPKLKKKEQEILKPAVVEAAHIIAFRELKRLQDEELWQKGETKKYYTRLTEILRQYLENRFMVFSMEMTTSETLEALIRTGFRKDENYEKLKSVLVSADLVKFAKYKPDKDENETSFEDAWNFVLVTKKEETSDKSAEPEERRKEVTA